MLKRLVHRLRQRWSPLRREMLLHPLRGKWPKIAYRVIPDVMPTAADVEFCERLLVAYRRAKAETARADKPDIWTFTAGQQRAFLSVLDGGTATELAAILCNMNRHDATIGTVQGVHEYRRILKSPAYARWLALHTHDKLVALAEAVGAIPLENPEQGQWGENLYAPPEKLVAAIGQRLGLDIRPPEKDGGLLKVSVGDAFYSERDLNALYTAWLLRMSLSANLQTGRIAEIGAGSGRVLYWSWRLGIGRIDAFDLPHINCLQAYYLHKSEIGVPIILHGEREVDGPRVAIRPAHAFSGRSSDSFDLVLNQDSFPEINEDIVRKYLNDMCACASRFVSINHESRPQSLGNAPAQNRVSDLVESVGGFRLQSRTGYWLRKGYVVEQYDVLAKERELTNAVHTNEGAN